MRAIQLHAQAGSGGGGALALADVPKPHPAGDEVVIRVSVCAVCRTDLDLLDGRLAASHYPIIPGHQVVGRVETVGALVEDRRPGDRVGVAWIHNACGICAWCRRGEENLCPRFRATGCDANGGYAEYTTAPAAFTYPIPDALDDAHAAPLLCAGAIGWRSLRLTNLHDGDPLGFTGFGASAHLVLQLARHRFPNSPLFVFARNAAERSFALQLGAAWAGDTTDAPPAQLAAIVDTTPAWKPVVEALPRLMPGGRLVINAIRKSNADRAELSRIDYATDLWMEREIKSVANVTRQDVREMLDAAVRYDIRPTVREMPLADAWVSLRDLAHAEAVRGATVLRVAERV